MKIIFMCLFLLISENVFSAMTLQDFKKNVLQKNKNVISSFANLESNGTKELEKNAQFVPAVFLNSSFALDDRLTASTATMGNRNTAFTQVIGLSKQTSFGLKTSVSYTLNNISIEGASQLYLPVPKYYDDKFGVELSQSLLKNGFGRENKLISDMVEKKYKASSKGELYKIQLALLEAENNYWKVVLARDALVLQKTNVERAKKMKEWTARRVSLNLADKSDLIQAETLLKVRELELKSANDDLVYAERQFNISQNEDVNTKIPELEKLDISKLLNYKKEIEYKRNDIEASKISTEIMSLTTEASTEKLKPNLEAFANFYLTGKDASFGTSFSNSFSLKYPQYILGLKFILPLNFSEVRELEKAYNKEKIASEAIYERKVYEYEQEWKNLNTKITDSNLRLNLLREIENMQSAKLEAEREKYNKGRSTTAILLTFEQDFSSAQVNRIKAQAELIALVTQINMFSGGIE